MYLEYAAVAAESAVGVAAVERPAAAPVVVPAAVAMQPAAGLGATLKSKLPLRMVSVGQKN